MSRKQILVFSDWFVPGFKAGGPIKSLRNLIDHVDADFFVITRITDYHDQTPYPNVQENQWSSIASNCSVLYINENRMNVRFVLKTIKERAYDLYYLNSLFSLKFTLMPLLILKWCGESNKTIVAPRGMLKRSALNVKAGKKRYFLKVAKGLGFYSNVLWHATNKEEVEEIKLSFGQRARVHLAPVIPSGARLNKKLEKRVMHLRIVSLSRISIEKGIKEAILAVNQIPNDHSVCFDIYGAKVPSEYTEECEKLARDSYHKIRLMGEINPSEIPNKLSEYDVFLLATHGENFGHAIAEALLSGTPVVISNNTPWQNLEEQKAGFNLPLEVDRFADKLIYFSGLDASHISVWNEGALELGRSIAFDESVLLANRILFE